MPIIVHPLQTEFRAKKMFQIDLGTPYLDPKSMQNNGPKPWKIDQKASTFTYYWGPGSESQKFLADASQDVRLGA